MGSTSLTGDGDSTDDGDSTETISFDEESPISLSPSGVAELKVTVVPARRQTVTFEILSDAEEFDGFLTSNTVQVDDAGVAAVELRAPSSPSEFEIRASLELGAEARRKVIVSNQGTGTVLVSVNYEGDRTIEEWHASVWPRKGCRDLESIFSDSKLHGLGDGDIEIDEVPAGTLFSVTVRGDQLAGGCLTVMDLSTDQELQLQVTALDRPLSPNGGLIDLDFGLDPPSDEYATWLGETISASLTHLFSASNSEAEALLRNIVAELPAEKRPILLGLISDELNSEVESILSSPTALSEEIRKVLFAASVRLVADDVFVSELTLDGLESKLDIKTAGGVPAATAGFRVESDFQVEVGSGDAVSLGGELYYDPVLWLAVIAEDSVAQEMPAEDNAGETETPVDAIVRVSECEQLAALLWSMEDTDWEECDVSCLKQACEQQAATLWETLKSSGSESKLVVGISGVAEPRGNALIGELSGTWVGKTEGTGTSLKGPVSGRAR